MTTNRRQFLQTGVTVSALPLASVLSSPHAAARMEDGNIPLSKAIFDDRYAEARSCAEAIARTGVPIRALNDGDVTDLWHEERDSIRRKPAAAIAGTTQFGPMFVFEQLGKEHRMRLALCVEHRVRGDGTIVHVMEGPAETLALAELVRLQGADWPAVMSALLMHCRAARAAPIARTMLVPGTEPVLTRASVSGQEPESVIHYYTPHAIREGHGVSWDGPLFSWVIAHAAPASVRPM